MYGCGCELSSISVNFVCCLQSSPIPIYCRECSIDLICCCISDLFHHYFCRTELNSSSNAFVAPYCVSVYHTLQPPPPTQRLKAAQEGRFLVSSSTLVLTVDAKCCVRMHFPTEMCPLSCATNQLAYVTMQPSSPPQTHPLTTPRIINHYSIVFTWRRGTIQLRRRISWLMSSDARKASSCDVYFRETHGESNGTASETCKYQSMHYASPCRSQWIAVRRPIGHSADVPK